MQITNETTSTYRIKADIHHVDTDALVEKDHYFGLEVPLEYIEVAFEEARRMHKHNSNYKNIEVVAIVVTKVGIWSPEDK